MQPKLEASNNNKINVDGVGNSNERFIKLPTGKPHVSFSELRVWQDCTYRHKLQFIDQIEKFQPSSAIDFGIAVHAAHEQFIKTKLMDPTIATTMIQQLWEKNDHKDLTVKIASEQAIAALSEIPEFYEKTFPNWSPIAAELQLYEEISNDHQQAFKGFIDAIIEVPGPKGKKTIWILDLKSTSWGWQSKKKSDPNVTQQLTFYKNFWTKKVGVDPKNVKCGFIILKRTAKDGGRCELVKVSVGDVTTGRSLKVLRSMLTTVKKGIAIKNRSSCTYCPYLNTEHCVLQKNALVTPVSQILRCHEIS
jgi:hypothetical protein